MRRLANVMHSQPKTRNPKLFSMKALFTFLLVILSTAILSAQEEVPMADGMRSEGKIYVVVAIVLVILLGLAGYLVQLDRKVSKVEKQFKN
jgi:uncharacterized protein HemX